MPKELQAYTYCTMCGSRIPTYKRLCTTCEKKYPTLASRVITCETCGSVYFRQPTAEESVREAEEARKVRD